MDKKNKKIPSKPAVLGLIEHFLLELEKSGIPYCHWKSNIDLDISYKGQGDLDILVDRKFSSAFSILILELGFKRSVVVQERQFSGIEDYLGWDRNANVLVHLHIHYQLVLGENYVKSFHLPVEQAMLDNRKSHGLIQISAPEYELLVFILRHTLRIRFFDILIWRKYKKVALEEQESLTEKTDVRALNKLLATYNISTNLFGNAVAALKSRSPWQIFRSKTKLVRQLKRFRYAGAFETFAKPVIVRLKYRLQRIFGKAILRARPASGGVLIAVVGSDGSGKSSLVNELDNWLHGNYAVETYHLGKPRQSVTSYIMLRVAIRIERLFTNRRTSHKYFPAVFAMIVIFFFIAKDRHRTYLSMKKSVGRGHVVIVDRFPLRNVAMDNMSSIAQYHNSKNPVIRWLIKKTEIFYKDFTDPDVLLVLEVSLDVAAKRRPDDTQEYLVGRIEAVKNIRPGKNVLIINAEMEHSKVIREAKEFIWRWL